MFKLPLRKFYYVFKVCFIIIVTISVLVLFEHLRGGRQSVGGLFMEPREAELERQVLEDEARIIPGLGEGGAAAYLSGEEKILGEESEKKLALNVYLSDRIAYNRTLKDFRNPACKRVIYDSELPSASVIIIFHNEPYSVVIRTLWSVINSARRDNPWFRTANNIDKKTGEFVPVGFKGQDPDSTLVYLKEIILVDDNSTLPELKDKLSHYIRTRLPPDLIRILRLPDREGLILARVAGARLARGEVLIFLDAHCEVLQDWLRPLLQRIKDKTDSVVTPIVDVIDQSNFGVDAATNFQVGGFTFNGHFTWIDVPEREKKRRGSNIAPTWSPTMAGGLFAMKRSYYWELGAYDEQMSGWGGENLEISFRIWQCGGTLETVPCSRVGHVFRKFHPYGMPASSDTHGINTARMAEVWMDEYAELFYLYRPDLRKNPKIGDVTHRKILREKLKCKSFQWYLDNIYSEKFVPVRDVDSFGRFMNPLTGLCLDNLQSDADPSPLGVYPCHPTLQPTQYLSISLDGQLRDEEHCAYVHIHRRDLSRDKEEGIPVMMVDCQKHSKEQKWNYLPATQQIQNVESKLCLESPKEIGAGAVVKPCSERKREQRWYIDYTEKSFKSKNIGDSPLGSQEEKLMKLRGQRRVSRSLLSQPQQQLQTQLGASRRRHSAKKNKFLLKLLRNNSGTEEHLEVELNCKHRTLYPNDTFVRDIVTILNDKDIKVLNNGRVFERNRVYDLPNHNKRKKTKKSKKKHKKSKHHRSTATLPPPTAPPPPPSLSTMSTPMERKIIVENFVVATTEPTTTLRIQLQRLLGVKRVPKRKRSRKVKRPSNSDFMRLTTPPTTVQSEETTQTSTEDDDVPEVPMASVDDDMKIGHAAEDLRKMMKSETYEVWKDNDSLEIMPQLLNSRKRTNHRNRVKTRQSDEKSQETEPLKLVMRSNLTFNLGEELLRAHDDVAGLLGELVLPDGESTKQNASLESSNASDSEST